MFVRIEKIKGQSLVEIAVLLTVAVLAIAGIFGYVRSGMMHQMKTGADAISGGMRY